MCACGTKQNVNETKPTEAAVPAKEETSKGEATATPTEEELPQGDRYSTGAKIPEGNEEIYLMNDEGSTIHIYANDEGTLNFDVSLYRITTFENGNGIEMFGGCYVFEMYAGDAKLSCELNLGKEGYYSLDIVASEWDVVKAGDSYGNFEKQ